MTSDQATVGAFLVAALVALAAAARWVWPYLHRFFGSLNETFDTINGKPARYDRAGRLTQDARPSLTAQLADLRAIVADQTEQNSRITSVEILAASNASRIDRLESGNSLPRIADAAEVIAAKVDADE